MAQRRSPKSPNTKPTVSIGLLLVAVALYFLAQWGGLGALSGVPSSAPAPTGIVAGLPGDEDPVVAPATTAAPTATRTARATESPRATDEPVATANAPPAGAAAPEPTATSRCTATPRPTATPQPSMPRASDLPTIAYADLPPEAHDTIALIDDGGPFPFRQDDSTFQNRERILPRKAEGYYREYTVITPGEDDRGARRIVAGRDGEMYYTDDHYDSFHEIIREGNR